MSVRAELRDAEWTLGLASALAVTIPSPGNQTAMPLLLHVEGIWQLGGRAHLKAQAQIGWQPMGLQWLKIAEIGVEMEFDQKRVDRFVLLHGKEGSREAPHCLSYGYFTAGCHGQVPLRMRLRQV